MGTVKEFKAEEKQSLIQSLLGKPVYEDTRIEGLYGYKLESDVKFDYSKSLVKQIWNANLSVEKYAEYIMEPKHLINPIRDVVLFDNPVMEVLTKSPWYAIILGWAPVVVYWLMKSGLHYYETGLYFLVGIFLWSLIEYLMHRFLFHAEDHFLPQFRPLIMLHFLTHGVHHCFPMDRYRLVFPIVPGYIMYNLAF